MPDLLILGACEPLELQAAEPGKESAPKKFTTVAYTGAAIRQRFSDVPVVVDIAGVTVTSQQVPTLRQHDPERIVGHTESIDLSERRIKAAGVISGVGEDTDHLKATAANGFPWQTSISGPIGRIEYVEPGKSVKVNGRNFVGPIEVVRAMVLREISFTPLGADGGTSAAIAAISGGSVMDFEAWVKAKGFDPVTINAEQKAFLEASWKAAQNPNPASPPPPPVPVNRTTTGESDVVANLKKLRDDNARTDGIAALTLKFGKANPGKLDLVEAIAKEALEQEWDVVQTELAMLRECRATAPNTRATSSDSASPIVIEAALCKAMGLRSLERHYSAEVLEATDRHFRRGITLCQPYFLAAQANGYRGTSQDLQAMMEYAHQHQLAGPGWMKANASTINVPYLLSNAGNKILMDMFLAGEQTWRDVGKITNAKDYKTFDSLRMVGVGPLKKVARGGEIEHGAIGEQRFQNKVDPYALMIGIGEEDYVNDDLQAFADVTAALGTGSIDAINNNFWDEFIDAQSELWPTNDANDNYISGATTVLSNDGLDQGDVKFRLQTKPKANAADEDQPLGLLPAVLLTGATNGNKAAALMGAQTFVGVSSGTLTPNENMFKGRYKAVSSAYLDTLSTTVWWLLANPMQCAAIQIAFLGGQQNPVIESNPFDFNRLGQQWRARFAFGVRRMEYRAGVKSKGAA